MRRHPDSHSDSGEKDDEGDELEDAVDEPEASEGENADHDAAGWEEEAERDCCADGVSGDFEF
jgi:hypothetical protein